MLSMQMIHELVQAIANAKEMTPEERKRRMTMATIARDLYKDGWRLFELASAAGDEPALTFLEESDVLNVNRVWPVEEAEELQRELAAHAARLQGAGR